MWPVLESEKRNRAPAKSLGGQHGFTLVELIMTMVIIGILAVVVGPRFFDRNTFDTRGFYDQVKATLRYAQKAAIAKHRFVCVTFAANSVTLTYDATPPSAAHTAATCPGAAFIGPDGSPYSVISTQASFAAVPSAFNFDPLGRPSGGPFTISVSGATPITVEQETGYVH